MTSISQRPLRLSATLALVAFIAACSDGPLDVREGPQEVHPAPPAINHFGSDCHSHSGKGCHTHAGDGSQPIID